MKIVRYKTAFYSFYLPIALGMHLSGHATDELLAQAKTVLLPMGEFFQIQACSHNSLTVCLPRISSRCRTLRTTTWIATAIPRRLARSDAISRKRSAAGWFARLSSVPTTRKRSSSRCDSQPLCYGVDIASRNRSLMISSVVAAQTKYGKEDPECVKAIKALYKELDLESLYKQTEEQSYTEVRPFIGRSWPCCFVFSPSSRLQLKGKIEAIAHAPLKHALHLLLAKIYKRSA